MGGDGKNEKGGLTREQLDEFALSVQRRLRNYQHARMIKDAQTALSENPLSVLGGAPSLESLAGARASAETYTPLPFCAFNGGSDVWLDIGNKLIGVQILQEHLATKPHETLHVGDQFLATGNDILTRSCACTVWITSPKETGDVLVELSRALEEGGRKVQVIDATKGGIMSRTGGTFALGKSTREMGFDELIKRMGDGFFGVLFITNKNNDENIFWHFLELFIDHIQDIGFPLASLVVPWQSEIAWLQTVINWTSPEKM
ncbi:IMP 5'-nucleotidase, partial [Chytridiales sp. JEL 0842]